MERKGNCRKRNYLTTDGMTTTKKASQEEKQEFMKNKRNTTHSSIIFEKKKYTKIHPSLVPNSFPTLQGIPSAILR